MQILTKSGETVSADICSLDSVFIILLGMRAVQCLHCYPKDSKQLAQSLGKYTLCPPPKPPAWLNLGYSHKPSERMHLQTLGRSQLVSYLGLVSTLGRQERE